MNKQWPSEFLSDARAAPGKVLGEEYTPLYPDACPNCGGYEEMFAFYVDSGPFETMPPSNVERTLRFRPEYGGWFLGRLRSAPCPVCAGVQKGAWLRRVCGLEGRDLDIRLADFREMPGKEQARAAAEKLLKLEQPRGFVTFWGRYGAGKSTLIKALVNGFRDAGTLSVYRRMSDLLANVRETFGDNSRGAAEHLLDEFRQVRVLAIDEVDRVNMTAWATETMFRLLDVRYESQDRALTILATNTAPGALPEELAYLGSRMTSGVVIQVGGDDVRAGLGLKATRELLHE